ncbi:hypothetical protein RUL21_001253, partial [Vibrio parahaemolyticus]|nr:hypothetical protein [Vibrio parahaemolyticus]
MKESYNKNLLNDVILGYVFRILLMIISYMTIPLTLKYLGKSLYSEWVVVLSFIMWLGVSDLGISNSMRNYITKSIESKDKQIQSGVNYSFSLMLVISLMILLVINVYNYMSGLEYSFACFTLTLVLINLPFTISQAILLGSQNSPRQQRYQLYNGLIVISGVYLFLLFDLDKNLLLMSILYFLGIVSISYNSWRYILKNLKIELPKVINIKKERHRELEGNSFIFFIIQVSGLIVFSTDFYLMSLFFNSDAVTEYFLIDKLYSTFNIFITILLVPIWGYMAKAKENNNFLWIRQKLLLLISLFFILSLFLYLISNYDFLIIEKWTGINDIKSFDKSDSIYFFVGSIFLAFNSLFTIVANGLNIIKIQAFLILVGA